VREADALPEWLILVKESENVTWLEEYPSGWEAFTWPPEPFGRYRMQTARSYLTYGLIFYEIHLSC